MTYQQPERMCIPKTPSGGFPSNVTHCYFPVAFLAQVPFLHVVDLKGIRRGWDLRDTQSLKAKTVNQLVQDSGNDEQALHVIVT